MQVAEEVYERDTPCSSRFATFCSESGCRHWLAQLKQLSIFVWTHITRFGHGRDWLSQKLNEKIELVQKTRLGPGYDSEATGYDSEATVLNT